MQHYVKCHVIRTQSEQSALRNISRNSRSLLHYLVSPAGAKQRELAKRVVAKQQVCEADKVRAAQLVFRTAVLSVQAEAVRRICSSRARMRLANLRSSVSPTLRGVVFTERMQNLV